MDNFSWKCVLHYLQLWASKDKFEMYDYGKKQNLFFYGSTYPPLYPIENITTPVLLVTSVQDNLTTLEVRFFKLNL